MMLRGCIKLRMDRNRIVVWPAPASDQPGRYVLLVRDAVASTRGLLGNIRIDGCFFGGEQPPTVPGACGVYTRQSVDGPCFGRLNRQ
jgi:hypothetical protein